MKALRVLLVEDEPLLVMAFVEVLEDMGHVVCAVEATEGAAVRAANLHKPDLLIVDIRLSEGNGVSAVATILQSGFIPHLFIGGDIACVSALMPDAVAIQKPFLASDLSRGIGRALGAGAAA